MSDQEWKNRGNSLFVPPAVTADVPSVAVFIPLPRLVPHICPILADVGGHILSGDCHSEAALPNPSEPINFS